MIDVCKNGRVKEMVLLQLWQNRVLRIQKMDRDLQNKLNVDPSQYDMELEFLFIEHTFISIPSVMVASEIEMKV